MKEILKNIWIIKRLRLILFSVFVTAQLFMCVGCSDESDIVIDKTNVENDDEISSQAQSVEEDNKMIVVYVCGAVEKSGVYEIVQGSRICDAVNAAGGMTNEAALDTINLATPVSDGEQIRVPYEGEELSVSGNDNAQSTGSDLININTATKEQLMTLSGIGEAKADAIISYRDTNGKFSNIEDLKKIEGIKDGVYNKIKDKISIN